MNTTAEVRVRTPLRDSLDLGEFTLLLRDETIESGAPLAAQIREDIAAAFVKLEPLLSLVYDLEITEWAIVAGSRSSKNKVRLKRKKGRTLREKIFAAVSAVSLALGFLSADYSKIPENLETACRQVIMQCNIHGTKAEIPEKHFPPVVSGRPSSEQGPPGSESL